MTILKNVDKNDMKRSMEHEAKRHILHAQRIAHVVVFLMVDCQD